MEPKWTDEQLAEMEKLVVDLEDKKNSKEEIQSQLDVLKSSFKAKTTAVAPDATAVEVEASNGESNLDPGSLDLQNIKDPKVKKSKIKKLDFDKLEEEDLVPKLKQLYPDMRFEEDGVPFRDGLKIKIPGDLEYTTIPLDTQYNKDKNYSFLGDSAYDKFLQIAERSKNTKGLDRDVFTASNGAILDSSEYPRFNTTNQDVKYSKGKETNIGELIINPKVGDEDILNVLSTVEGEILNLFQDPTLLEFEDGTFDSQSLLRQMQEGVLPETLKLIRDQSFVKTNENLEKQNLPPLGEDSFQDLFKNSYEIIQQKAIKRAKINFNTKTAGETLKPEFYKEFDSLEIDNLTDEKAQFKVKLENQKLKLLNDLQVINGRNQEDNSVLNKDAKDKQAQIDLINKKIANVDIERQTVATNEFDYVDAKTGNVRYKTEEKIVSGLYSSTFFSDEETALNPDYVKNLENTAKQANEQGKYESDNLYQNDSSKTKQQYALELYENKVLDLQKIRTLGTEETLTFNLNKIKKQVDEKTIQDGDLESFASASNFSVESQLLRKFNSAGLFGDTEGNVKISPFDLQQLGISSRNFVGFLDEISTKGFIDDANIEKLRAYEELYDGAYSEAKGLFRLSKLNVDPSKIEKNNFIENIAAVGVKTMATQWLDKDEKEVEQILTGDQFNRTILDSFNNSMEVYNSSEEVTSGKYGKMKLNEAQALNLGTTLSEEISAGVGNFVPMIIELGAMTYASGGVASATGFASVLNNLKNGNKFRKALYHGLMGMNEEAKMQIAFDIYNNVV